MDYTNEIKKYIELEIETLKKLDVQAINAAANLIDETRKAGNTIYIFGNGGSSATASHYQNDFNKGVSEYLFNKNEPKFKFQCLNDNVATIMAIANDIGFEEEYAKSCGNKIIGLTGYKGGKLKELSDISLHVDVMSMQTTEDIHMIFDHLIMSLFYRELAGIEHLKA